jgi:hypothetical protein
LERDQQLLKQIAQSELCDGSPGMFALAVDFLWQLA